MSLRLYEVNSDYIDYLLPYAPHLFHNKKAGQNNSRKFIGVILTVNDMEYFAPLSSFKPKHEKIKNGIDFLKIGKYAVINLNCMFPVPDGQYTYVDINNIKNPNYRMLLINEYAIIRGMQDKIRTNAEKIYKYKSEKENSTPLAKRCNDFKALEKACSEYKELCIK